jgi:Fic-DOC domain mobile mystery protein B
VSWVYDHAQLDAVEADNIRLAAGKYLEKKRYSFPKWFTVFHINQVHKAMFNKVWTWAGKYRQTLKSIGVVPYKIQLEMANLWEDIKFWGQENSFDPTETAARVHHRLVWIHPYENGNGRHGRFIGDMVLRAFGYERIVWPKLADSNEERNVYIQALKDADRGDFTALINFLVRHRTNS